MPQNPFQKMQENLADLTTKLSSFDKEALIKSHKKNLETLTQAHTIAVDMMKTITRMQTEYMKQTFEDFSTLLRMSSGHSSFSPEILEKKAQHRRESLDKTFQHASDIGETFSNGHKEILGLVHNRIAEGAQQFSKASAEKKAAH